MSTNNLFHALRQYRRLHESEVTAEEFSKRISACGKCPRRSDLRCLSHNEVCASYAKPQNNACEAWDGGEPPPIPEKMPPKPHRFDRSERITPPAIDQTGKKPERLRGNQERIAANSTERRDVLRGTRPRINKMAVVSCFFNPTGDPRLENNARRFRESLGVPVTFCELSFNGSFLFSDSIQLNGDESCRYIWQKERLLNIAISSLPADVDAVAIIDADLLFENRNWYRDALLRLQNFDVVQLFEKIEYLNAAGDVEKTCVSFANSSASVPGMPGGAVAFRRSLIGTKGLHEKRILGGGDSVMMRRWYDCGLEIKSVPGVVRHLYHGDFRDRQQLDRVEILKKTRFDFEKHIVATPGEPLKWARSGRGLMLSKRAAKKFFERRAGTAKKTTIAEKIRGYFRGSEHGKTAGSIAPAAPSVAVSITGKNLRGDGLRVAGVTPEVVPVADERRRRFACDVVLPYNAPNYLYLEDSIESILNQNFVDVVLHLINDGMDSDPIGEKFNRLENVRLYRTEDGPVGPYVILNRLFDYLETDYFANQDSDDIALPMRLYKSFLAASQGFDIVGGCMEQFVTYSSDDDRMRKALSMKPYHFSGVRRAASPSGCIVNSTALIKKSVYEDLNGMAPWLAGADSEFYERAIMAGVRSAYIDDIVSLRRLHSPSLSNDQVTSGHGSKLREQIKRDTAASIARQKIKSCHAIGGLKSCRGDRRLVLIQK